MIISPTDFSIGTNISSGATSIVYLGTFQFVSVAIKKICLYTLCLKGLQSIVNELFILDRLKHPNIILVLGFSIDD